MIQKLQDSRAVLLGAVAIFSLGLTTSGYLLGDGLRRAKMAERSVTVRGVSERDVTADLATWTVSFAEEGTDLAPVQASVDQKSRAVREFLVGAGFKPDEISDTAISATQSYDKDREQERVTVSRSIQLRSRDVVKVRRTYAGQSELIRDGVPLSSSEVAYVFTGLNSLKAPMIAEANQNARRSAEQFARDSGAAVGRIKTASQGYFSVGARDGDTCEDCNSSGSGSPFQKVRVVTTIDYDLA
ncbi:MAG: SIMPL domain-containing protein [Sphingomicrobium sp.]